MTQSALLRSVVTTALLLSTLITSDGVVAQCRVAKAIDNAQKTAQQVNKGKTTELTQMYGSVASTRNYYMNLNQQSKKQTDSLRLQAAKLPEPKDLFSKSILGRLKKGRKVSNEKILERFLSYVSIDSQSHDNNDYSVFPLSEGQKEIAAYVAEEIMSMNGAGVEVTLSDKAYVYVKIPSNLPRKQQGEVPSILFTAHLDVTPECAGKGISPKVTGNYAGGDIELSPDIVISPESPEGARLKGLIGKTIITTDGTTLLGGDDKAGCTILTTVIENLIKNPQLKHGDVYFVYSNNEDIGRAGEHFDASEIFGTQPDIIIDCDGVDPHGFSNANFTASRMSVMFDGNDRHPGDGMRLQYADALTASSYFIGQLPPEKHPSASSGTQGYIHCYEAICPIGNDGKEETEDKVVNIRIRYFDKAEGDSLRNFINAAITKTQLAYPFVKITATDEVLQYENVAYTMWEGTEDLIINAARKVGMYMKPQAERGGTTAAMIVAAKGLNGGACIFSGQNNPHSKMEWVCLEEMSDIVALVHQIIHDLTITDAD